MRQPMEARAAVFVGALRAASRTAARVQLGHHVQSRIQLAATYAVSAGMWCGGQHSCSRTTASLTPCNEPC